LKAGPVLTNIREQMLHVARTKLSWHSIASEFRGVVSAVSKSPTQSRALTVL
jgi:hypothetical protein